MLILRINYIEHIGPDWKTFFAEQAEQAEQHQWLFCCKMEPPPPPPLSMVIDEFHSYEAAQLIDEIQNRLRKLTQIGVSELVLQSIFKFDVKPVLSRILITKDFKIILPDYRNMQISLEPLPKTVWLFYLRHPEGVMFKHLIDYRQEILHIYSQISNRENFEKMKRSIDVLIDSTGNAINEKCSRIREAFLFDSRLAENYYITGERGTPKKILIDRSLVTWETTL